eukprot:tig00020734_g13602.t1
MIASDAVSSAIAKSKFTAAARAPSIAAARAHAHAGGFHGPRTLCAGAGRNEEDRGSGRGAPPPRLEFRLIPSLALGIGAAACTFAAAEDAEVQKEEPAPAPAPVELGVPELRHRMIEHRTLSAIKASERSSKFKDAELASIDVEGARDGGVSLRFVPPVGHVNSENSVAGIDSGVLAAAFGELRDASDARMKVMKSRGKGGPDPASLDLCVKELVMESRPDGEYTYFDCRKLDLAARYPDAWGRPQGLCLRVFACITQTGVERFVELRTCGEGRMSEREASLFANIYDAAHGLGA